MPNLTISLAEMYEDLITGVHEGQWIAYMQDGQLRFKHPDHATASELTNRLTAEETRTMLRLEDEQV